MELRLETASPIGYTDIETFLFPTPMQEPACQQLQGDTRGPVLTSVPAAGQQRWGQILCHHPEG